MPSDLQGVIYKPMDDHNGWYTTVANELKRAGFTVDLNRLLDS